MYLTGGSQQRRAEQNRGLTGIYHRYSPQLHNSSHLLRRPHGERVSQAKEHEQGHSQGQKVFRATSKCAPESDKLQSVIETSVPRTWTQDVRP